MMRNISVKSDFDASYGGGGGSAPNNGGGGGGGGGNKNGNNNNKSISRSNSDFTNKSMTRSNSYQTFRTKSMRLGVVEWQEEVGTALSRIYAIVWSGGWFTPR